MPPRRGRSPALHGVRLGLFVAIVGLIHYRHIRDSDRSSVPLADVGIEAVRTLFPSATALGEADAERGDRAVLDASGTVLGTVIQTSPQGDHVIGFSGPTNVLIAFGPDGRVRGLAILSSGDTRDHVRQVRQDGRFLRSLDGCGWSEVAGTATEVDAVSGATLTSLAILESIAVRLGSEHPSLRFTEPIAPDRARRLFPEAAATEKHESIPSLWRVCDAKGAELGTILRTSPAADQIIGYQGPTDTHIGFGPDGRVVGIRIGRSYDNQPYVDYVRDDEYFLALFEGFDLARLAGMDPKAEGIDGVSGATMTSQAVAQGLVSAAADHRRAIERASRAQTGDPRSPLAARDVGTAVMIAAGLVIGLTRLRGNRFVRVAFQWVLIGYLGLVNGDLVSQALLVGWAQHGVPWRNALGLVLLTFAALLLPTTTKRNLYCTHLCPHGAAQQLLMHRLPWRLRLGSASGRLLAWIPAALLFWCVLVAMVPLPFSLVDIEPFDAWVFRVSGWASISIAVVGLVASLFVPMAYCRYGCPTGALLNYLRRHSHDRWTPRDGFALLLVLLAAALLLR